MAINGHTHKIDITETVKIKMFLIKKLTETETGSAEVQPVRDTSMPTADLALPV
jgi:hypothetical protein